MKLRTRVIIWVLVLFTAAFIIDALGQTMFDYTYRWPDELLEFSKMAVAAALGTDIFLAVRGHLKKSK